MSSKPSLMEWASGLGAVGCCLLIVAVFVAALWLGPLSLHYIIWAGWGINAAYSFPLILCGLLFSETTIPVAAVVWLVVSLGVHTPFFAH